MFGLKTEQLYRQPGPWTKSFPLTLNKQSQILLTPCSQLTHSAYLGPACYPGPVLNPRTAAGGHAFCSISSLLEEKVTEFKYLPTLSLSLLIHKVGTIGLA